MTTETFEVQQTILDQIRSLDKWALGAWGTREMKVFDNTLQFRVNGTKLKRGWIEVEYKPGSDTYTIRGIYRTNLAIKIRAEFDNVYCENLVQVIDSIVG